MNKSMQLLKDWCSLNDWVCEQIPEEKEEKLVRTPDYKLTIGGKVIYAEVKEIVANDKEKKVIKQLSERGWADAYGEEPGKTIRKKIRDAYGQIKRLSSQNDSSGILVLYNNSGIAGLGRLRPYHVLTGMFGLQTIPIMVLSNPNMSPSVSGSDYLGKKKSVTNKTNRYLSGIMILYESYKKGLKVLFYHNPYAKIPIAPEIIAVDNCNQYKLNLVEI